MDKVTIMHIGDIHFPGINREHQHLDIKDRQLLKTLENILPKKSYENIMEILIKEINNSTQAILISGDLSDGGDIEGYVNCLKELKKRINNFDKKETCRKLFIVPGNHDVIRDNVCDESLSPKFKPLNEALKSNNFPEIPFPEKIKVGEINEESGKVVIISINSCAGCGEKRYYPEIIREALSSFLLAKKKKAKGKVDKKEEIQLFEKIDTPICTDKDVEDMICCMESNKSCLPIILTHHNLLPQSTSRLAMYTELLNSGDIREKLLALDRPILYLHGHVHDDPIEIIRSPIYKKAIVICSSAPLLFPIKNDSISTKFGFNKIKIFFGNHGIPVGCEIVSYRLNKNRIETKKSEIRFVEPPLSISLASYKERNISKLISKEMYLTDLLDKINENEDKKILIEDLEECINNLSWLGLVVYEKDENNMPLGSVKRVIPC